MLPLALRAHYDGEQIRLDEPCDLTPDTRLLVLVLADQTEDREERKDWSRLSLLALEQAYGEDEPEYQLDTIRVSNPDYDGR